MNLVSIIVPVYNAREHIKQCLDSILNQTYRNIEIICVDDGSKDDSADIIRQYASKDSRVHYEYKQNGGVSSARNAGLRIANGAYIQFVDSDDAICPDMTDSMVRCLEENNAGLAICGYRLMIHHNTAKVPPAGILSDKDEIIDAIPFLYTNFFLHAPWNKLFRSSYLTHQFDKSISLGEDLIFNLEYLSKIERITMLSQALYIYRDDLTGSLTKKHHPNAFDALRKRIVALEIFCSERATEVLGAISNNLFEEYMTCLHGEVFKSGHSFHETINTLRTWNQSAEVKRYIKGSRNSKALQYLVDRDMMVSLFLYLKVGAIKRSIVEKFYMHRGG